jgi:hypothetical protein
MAVAGTYCCLRSGMHEIGDSHSHLAVALDVWFPNACPRLQPGPHLNTRRMRRQLILCIHAMFAFWVFKDRCI